MIQTQISDLDRHIVIAIVLNGSPVSEEQIDALLINLKESGLDLTSEYPTIDNTMRGLVGSVLNRNINKDGQVNYSLFNPSIADFVISEYLNRVDYLAKLMSCLRTTNVLINVGVLVKSAEMQLDFDALLFRLFHLELDSELTPNLYSMQLAELIEKIKFNISEMAKKLIDSHANNLFGEFGLSSVKVLMMALKHNFISPNDPYIREVVIKALENIELSFLGVIAALIQNSSYEDELTEIFKKEVV